MTASNGSTRSRMSFSGMPARRPGDQSEESRFTAAGRTDNGEEFSAPQIEVERAQRMKRFLLLDRREYACDLAQAQLDGRRIHPEPRLTSSGVRFGGLQIGRQIALVHDRRPVERTCTD